VQDQPRRTSGREKTTLDEGSMNEAPSYIPPILGFTLAHDQDIGKQTHPTERSPEPDRLRRRIADGRLDNKEIQVTMRPSITPGV
jgi:hypothetical protein